MADIEFFRGGSNLLPRRDEVRFDRKTGLVMARRGLSVSSRPEGLDRFGGAYRLTNVPPELQIIQIGHNPEHYEIIPRAPMTFEHYEAALQRIARVPQT